MFTSIEMTKQNGQLIPLNTIHVHKLKSFKETIPEGTIVRVYLEVSSPLASKTQMALLHRMIKELASFTGHTVNEMKVLIKSRTGLCINRTTPGNEHFECQSFADCSVEELMLSIESCYELASELQYAFST